MNAVPPKKKAIEISKMLNEVLGTERFPVDVEGLIYEYTKQQFDPVTKIRKVSLDGFEGMLRPSRKKKEWHILYNENPIYKGRERFTLAHEFSHYLLDRRVLDSSPQSGTQDLSFQCNPLSRNLWKEEEVAREENADIFASYLLMPIDDFRQQVKNQQIDIDLFRHITNRYSVSLTAAILKWIEFTNQLAAMVVTRDGFALWSKSSERAYTKGAFIRSGMKIPEKSHANTSKGTNGKLIGIKGDIWPFFGTLTVTKEMSIVSQKLDLCISVLIFEETDHPVLNTMQSIYLDEFSLK